MRISATRRFAPQAGIALLTLLLAVPIQFPQVARAADHADGCGKPLVASVPKDYQVFQRGKPDEPIRVPTKGCVSVDCDHVRVRIFGRTQTGTGVELQRDATLSESRKEFQAQLWLLPGGWYRFEFEALRGDVVVARSSIEHVGLGEVFVVAGQSNATNYGSGHQKPASKMVANFDGATWRLADDPQAGVQDGSGGGSFMPAFGDALAANLGVPIGVVPVGAGATSIREWLPAGERMSQQPTTGAHVRSVETGAFECTGELFEGMIRRIEPLGKRGFRAILWHQGESDAGQARSGAPADRQITGTQYVEYMQKLIAASRKRLDWDMPWITAQTTYHNAQNPSDAEFRAAQKSLWEKKLAIEGPDTDVLGPEYRDGVHFNANGLQAHGRLWAEKVAAWLGAM